MQRAPSGLRSLPGARLAELERRAPEWRTWLRLLAEVERARLDPQWAVALSDGPLGTPTDTPPGSGAPLLHGRTLPTDGARVGRLLRRLSTLASAGGPAGSATLAGYRPSAEHALALLTAALRRDRSGLAQLAAARGIDAAALTSIAELAVIPLLSAAAGALRSRRAHWSYGYCPVCGAWPTLAERRGLERACVLRCGRCGADWPWEWLRCVFCGERNHDRLGLLVPAEARETRRAETCLRCRCYLKSLAVLQPAAPVELLVLDLDTVELDLAALDRGFARPDGNGYPIDVRVAARPRRPFRRLFTDA